MDGNVIDRREDYNGRNHASLLSGYIEDMLAAAKKA